MTILIVSSSVYWGRTGSGQLKDNWKVGTMQTPNAAAVAKQLFNGVCLGMLGLTGFECKSQAIYCCSLEAHLTFLGIPSYASLIKPGKFPLVLRNLHIPAIVLNPLLMLLILAVLPLDVVLGGANVLSSLADVVSTEVSQCPS